MEMSLTFKNLETAVEELHERLEIHALPQLQALQIASVQTLHVFVLGVIQQMIEVQIHVIDALCVAAVAANKR